MSGEIRAPLLRDKIISTGKDSFHAAVEVCEYGETEVYLTVWPIRAGCSAEGLDFPPEIWGELKSLVDRAIADWQEP